jgi:hypothetical protein
MNDDQRWWLTMPPAELAAVILPFFSSWEPQREFGARRKILAWLSGVGPTGLAGFFVSNIRVFNDPDERAVGEAIQHLEHACLLMREIDDGDHTTCYVGITRLGMHALQTNTVRQHLGLSNAPPTA